MQALLALVRAELKLHFSNRRALLMSIVAPILIAAFFGSLFGTSSKMAGIPVGVVHIRRHLREQDAVGVLALMALIGAKRGFSQGPDVLQSIFK